ncbi:MAG TPA: DNA-processing protein DprA [Lacipirellulaceae bacterium]|nr:DNA-processing protein DprA [Lacipirellulaceae bacterium]
MPELQFSDELVDSVRLSLVSGVGPLLRKALLARFGSPAAVLAAAKDELQCVDGIGLKIAARIVAARDEIDAEAELKLAAENGIDVLADADADYPRPLRQIHDPPGVLFRRGQSLPQDELAVAIVGTRHATRYGLAQAERLAGSLARTGFTVVSGLARGIDAAAHRGALAAGGRTIAVLASGILEIYPPEHEKLADEVAASGYLLSEAPPRMVPLSGAFPQRNRVISGLCVGTIVVEAPDRSGALITARHAYEQGREVFAVPGPVDSRMSRGCHALIKDGAKLVETIDDVLAELGPLAEKIQRDDGTVLQQPAEVLLNEIEQGVLSAIDSAPTSLDTIAASCGMPIHRVLSTISVLEMRRLIRRTSGTQVVRA